METLRTFSIITAAVIVAEQLDQIISPVFAYFIAQPALDKIAVFLLG